MVDYSRGKECVLSGGVYSDLSNDGLVAEEKCTLSPSLSSALRAYWGERFIVCEVYW